MSCEHVKIGRIGGTGRITLERPAKLNALSTPMVRAIATTLAQWARDPAVRAVLIDGAGPRGFCAGGDIGMLHASVMAGDGRALEFWREEYHLNALIAGFAKPLIAYMSGIVMGGGVGLGAHARHRIVTGSTRLAMPEVGLGLIPDVGSTWLLSRAPGGLGTYLALTGATIGAADTLALGLADYLVPDADLAALATAIAADEAAGDAGIRSIVERVALAPDAAPLVALRPAIDRWFGLDTVEEIVAALAADDGAFARATAQQIATRSPLSLKLTLRALRLAARLNTLAECLALEYRLVSRLRNAHDFDTGARATIVDKDRRPCWEPAELGRVSNGLVESYFISLGPTELLVAAEEEHGF